MPRISKSAVKAVIQETADRLLAAAGPDGIVSRKDAKAAAAAAPTEKEQAIARVFYGYQDHRDNEDNARVTGADLQRTMTEYVPHMVDRLEIGRPNGLSQAELKDASTTVKLAAAIVAERIAANKQAAAAPKMAQASQAMQAAQAAQSAD